MKSFIIFLMVVAVAVGCGGPESRVCINDNNGDMFCYLSEDCTYIDDSYYCTLNTHKYDSSIGDACTSNDECGIFSMCSNYQCKNTCDYYYREYYGGRNMACSGMQTVCKSCCCLVKGPNYSLNEYGKCEEIEPNIDCTDPFFLMSVKKSNVDRYDFKADMDTECEETRCDPACEYVHCTG